MPPLKIFEFICVYNDTIIITIKAYEEKDAKNQIILITQVPNDWKLK